MAAERALREQDSENHEARKPYGAPSLEEFGDLRELTLGASPGITDSGQQGKNSGSLG